MRTRHFSRSSAAFAMPNASLLLQWALPDPSLCFRWPRAHSIQQSSARKPVHFWLLNTICAGHLRLHRLQFPNSSSATLLPMTMRRARHSPSRYPERSVYRCPTPTHAFLKQQQLYTPLMIPKAIADAPRHRAATALSHGTCAPGGPVRSARTTWRVREETYLRYVSTGNTSLSFHHNYPRSQYKLPIQRYGFVHHSSHRRGGFL